MKALPGRTMNLNEEPRLQAAAEALLEETRKLAESFGFEDGVKEANAYAFAIKILSVQLLGGGTGVEYVMYGLAQGLGSTVAHFAPRARVDEALIDLAKRARGAAYLELEQNEFIHLAPDPDGQLQ